MPSWTPEAPPQHYLEGVIEAQNRNQRNRVMRELQERLMQEELNNAPVDRQYKQSMAEYQSALAKKAMAEAEADPAMRYADKLAKAAAQKRLEEGRSSRGLLETAMSMPEGRNEFLRSLTQGGRLRPDLVQRLEPDEKTSVYTDENINRIIRSLEAEDPEAAKTLREEMQQTGAMNRVKEQGQTARDVAGIRASIMRDIQAIKASAPGKPLSESQVVGSLLQKVANGEITPEELKALDVAQIIRASTKTVSPDMGITPSPTGEINIVPTQQKPSETVKPKQSNKERLRQLYEGK